MADKKISALTGATTPLAGTEVLPIVQGGSTVKVSVDNLTTGKAVTVKSLSTTTGLSGATQATDIIISRTSSTGAVLTGPNIYLDEGTANNTIAIQNGAGYFQVYGYNGSFVELLKVNNTGNVTAPIGNFVPATAGKGIDFSANTHAAGMTSELLNDYEEGTFTLTDPGVTSAVSGTWTFVSGKYTKVGRQVTINAIYSGTGLGFSANTGYYRWDGLPFTSAESYSGTWQGLEAFKACAGFAFTSGTSIWLHAAISAQTSDSGIVVTATYTV